MRTAIDLVVKVEAVRNSGSRELLLEAIVHFRLSGVNVRVQYRLTTLHISTALARTCSFNALKLPTRP